MNLLTLQVAQRGVITLPKSIRERYRLNPGDALTLLDLDGVLVLSPARSKVDRLADQLAQDLAERGESLETMLQALREARERYAA
jgi:AbrB family looped-hinge helix DNA binding protein